MKIQYSKKNGYCLKFDFLILRFGFFCHIASWAPFFQGSNYEMTTVLFRGFLSANPLANARGFEMTESLKSFYVLPILLQIPLQVHFFK